MHTGLTNATSDPAIGAEGLLRAPVRARGRGYPPILREGQAGTRRESFASRPGAGVARTRLSSEKPGPDFFFFGKSPTDSQSPGSGGWVRFRRSPATRRSSGLTSESRKPSRGSLEVRNETDVCAEAGLASSDQDVQATASCAEAVGVLIRTNGSPPQS